MTSGAIGMLSMRTDENIIAGALPAYLKVAEAARMIRRTPDTIRHWLKCGTIGGMRLNSGHWLVETRSLLEMMQPASDVKIMEMIGCDNENSQQTEATTQKPITV